MSTIKNYIYVKNHIPKEVCEELIDECNKGIWEKHKWYYNVTGSLTSDTTKELDIMHSTPKQQAKMTPYIVKALEDYQEKHNVSGEKTEGPWLSKISSIRFNRYTVGTKMKEHYDHIHSIFDGKMKGVPIVSIVANLNSDYEGCEFYCRREKIELKTGDILLFPSNFMYPHEVKEATKGTRYSFVSWAF